MLFFCIGSEVLENDWIPSSEAEALFLEGDVYMAEKPKYLSRISGWFFTLLKRLGCLASDPEFVGRMPIRTDLVVNPRNPLNWIQTGTRLQLISGTGPNAVIVGAIGNAVHIREVEHWDAPPLILGITVRSYTPEQVAELYRPLPPPMPSWFSVGSRVVQNNRTYVVLSFDPNRWSMTATLEDEMRPTNFSVNDFVRHWRPASSITEQRPTTNVTPIAPTVTQVAPEWLVQDSFLRRVTHPDHMFVVSSLDPSHFRARLTRLSSFNPVVVGSIFEEVDYCRVADQFTPIDQYRNPRSEYKCPKCSGIGERDYSAEERRSSIDRVRAYTCKENHTWYFIAGTNQDGQPTRSRFERDIGI